MDEVPDGRGLRTDGPAALDGWGDPVQGGESRQVEGAVGGAVGGAWPMGAGWGPGGAPARWLEPAGGVDLTKGEGDSGCGTDSEEDMEEEGERLQDDGSGDDITFAHHVSEAEYQKQRKEYTRQAVDSLVQSPEYQRKHKSCRSCWSVWLGGQSRTDCMECGGYALVRPCPICNGKCGSVWKRNIDMSHSNNEAHWDGECALSPEEQEAHMLQVFTDPSEEAILDGMMDLTTS